MNASTSLLNFRSCSRASQNSRAVTAYSSSNRSFSSQRIQCHNRILPAGTSVIGAKSQPKKGRAVVFEGCDTRADLGDLRLGASLPGVCAAAFSSEAGQED